jgi:hypothetical protein
MTNAHTARALGAAAAVAALSFGCTSRTKVAEQWRDPTYAAGPMHRVLVVAQNAPISSRKAIEDEFVDELEDEGVSAVPSHEVFGDNVPDVSAVRPMLTSNGYDGALVVTVQQVEQMATAVPQQNFYSAPFGSPMQPYDHPRLATQYTMQVDTGLWDLRGDKRVWGSKTRVENATYGNFASRVSKKVVGEVAKQGLLAPSR